MKSSRDSHIRHRQALMFLGALPLVQAVAIVLDLYLLGSPLPMVNIVKWAIAACPVLMILVFLLLQRFAGGGKAKGGFFIPVVGLFTSAGWVVGLSPS